MGLGGILQRLKTEGVLALYHDYRSGTFQDFSGNGNTGTPPATAYFTKRSVQLNSPTTAITIADNGTLRLPSLSVCVWSNFISQITAEMLYAVSVAPGTYRLAFYTSATSGLALFDGTATRTLLTNIVGRQCVAASIGAGLVPVGYVNGASAGNFSNLLTPTVGASIIEIGNANFANPIKSALKAVVVVSRVLTATEHQEIYQQLQALS